jgi:methionine biosynthesis protein MetW
MSRRMAILGRMFRATEDENRRVILECMPPRPGGRLLDLGCGDGVWTLTVADHTRVDGVHGVELSASLAGRARARGVDVVSADLSEPVAAFDDASFDVIHSNQVIEHVRDTDQFLVEVRRLLKPGGYALISTNNLSSWHNIVSLTLGWQPTPCNVSDRVNVGNPLNAYDRLEHADAAQTHLRVFTGKALSALAAYHGLRAVAERASGYYPAPPNVARHLARLDRRHAAFLVHRFELDPGFRAA